MLHAQPAWVRITAPVIFSVALLIDSALLRASGQCKKLYTVDRIHPALVRAVLQKKFLDTLKFGRFNDKGDRSLISHAGLASLASTNINSR